MKPTICLCMILKNEGAVIKRLLESVRGYVDTFAVVDTGKQSPTSRDWDMHGHLNIFAQNYCPLQPIVDYRPFDDFSSSRNYALDVARTTSADYILLTDADMPLSFKCSPSQFKESIALHKDAPAFSLEIVQGNVSYWRERIIKRDLDCRYVGATHEYMEGVPNLIKLHNAKINDNADGANRADKFSRDIGLLLPTRSVPRSVYYIAQSFRDMGDLASALMWYERRADMSNGWEEERWHARYQAGLAAINLGLVEKAEKLLSLALKERPWRAETYLALARLHRQECSYAQAAMCARSGMMVPYPADDQLFIEREAYNSLMYDFELSISLFYSPNPKDKELGKSLCSSLTNIPGIIGQTSRSNLTFYEDGGVV